MVQSLENILETSFRYSTPIDLKRKLDYYIIRVRAGPKVIHIPSVCRDFTFLAMHSLNKYTLKLVVWKALL